MKYILFYENSRPCSDFLHSAPAGWELPEPRLVGGWLLGTTDGHSDFVAAQREPRRDLILWVKSIGEMYTSSFRLCKFSFRRPRYPRFVTRLSKLMACVPGAPTVCQALNHELFTSPELENTAASMLDVVTAGNGQPASSHESSHSDVHFSEDLPWFGKLSINQADVFA